MKKYVAISAAILVAATLVVSLAGCASTGGGAKSSFDGTLDFTKASGDHLENNKQKDGSMFWIDNSWAYFDRNDYKTAAPAVQWMYGECPIESRNKWWQGFGANDLNWDLSGFTHLTITYKANRAGDEITFTLSEAHQTEARECSVAFTPGTADEWVELKVALEDMAVQPGANYQGKQFVHPTWSNINGWLFGAGKVDSDEGLLWIDSIVFTAEGVAEPEPEAEAEEAE